VFLLGTTGSGKKKHGSKLTNRRTLTSYANATGFFLAFFRSDKTLSAQREAELF
jgi:hypothetical protein